MTQLHFERAPTKLRVARAVAQFWAREGYAPSLRDIRDGGLLSSTSVVSYYLSLLRDEGLLTYRDGLARSVRLTPAGEEAVRDAEVLMA